MPYVLENYGLHLQIVGNWAELRFMQRWTNDAQKEKAGEAWGKWKGWQS